jgi:hypothetical protein
VGAKYFSGVLDGAPVLLCAGDDLPRIGNNSVAVTTVEAIEFFDAIQIGQLMPVHNYISISLYSPYPVQAKTDVLIDSDRQIEKGQGNDHGVNKRGGQDIPKGGAFQPGQNGNFQFAMSIFN